MPTTKKKKVTVPPPAQNLKVPAKPTTRVVAATDLVPDQANVRTRDDRAKSTLSASMKQFGPARSGVMSNGVMRAGNGSLEAFVAGGGTEALVVRPEPGQFVVVERDDWSPTEAVGYSLADNRSSDLASFGDDEALATTLEAIRVSGDIDLTAIGFDDEEIDALIASLGDELIGGDEPKTAAAAPRTSHTVVFSADIWPIVATAIERRREHSGDVQMSEARAIEMVCGAYVEPAVD